MQIPDKIRPGAAKNQVLKNLAERNRVQSLATIKTFLVMTVLGFGRRIQFQNIRALPRSLSWFQSIHNHHLLYDDGVAVLCFSLAYSDLITSGN